MGAQKGLIFGSMACGSWDFLNPYRNWPDVVIAADGGLPCARRSGFSPTVYIGDNDSGGEAEEGLECVTLNPVKDATDLQAAYEWARDRGLKELIFTGCSGGRQDHHLSALQLLERAHEDGIHAMLLDPWNQIEFLSPGSYTLPRTDYFYFSLIPVDRTLEGICIRGAKYPLLNHRTCRGDSLTVSNEWAEEAVELSVQNGCCYLIRSKNVS